MAQYMARDFPRHDTSFFVSCVDNPIDFQICRGNVSKSGFFIHNFKPTDDLCLSPGNELNLVFRLPGAGVWIKSTGLILYLDTQNNVFEMRGKLLRHDPIDLSILKNWLLNDS